DSPERMAAVVRSVAAGFTIGTAAFNGAFSGSADLLLEIEAEINVLERIQADAGWISPSELTRT
ncbi:4-hydroxythreonine-4-phosphate dehydrogenase, partial [Rhizobium ruizarguesonis]